MGRPSKFSEALSEKIYKLYKSGKTDAQVAYIIGVSVRTLNNWKGKHPKFLHALKEGKISADELVEASLFSRAVGYTHLDEKLFVIDSQVVREKTRKCYPPDVTAQIFWLKNRQPEKWRENYHFDINDLDKKTDEEIDSRINQLLEKKLKGEQDVQAAIEEPKEIKDADKKD